MYTVKSLTFNHDLLPQSKETNASLLFALLFKLK